MLTRPFPELAVTQTLSSGILCSINTPNQSKAPPMQANDKVQLMQTFYTRFQQHDYAGMIACYHPDIVFSDPVFTDLKGKQAGAMWHMLVGGDTDLVLT